MRHAHRQWVQETKDLGLIPEPEIMEREKKYGSRFAILRQPGGDALNARLGEIASLASEGPQALSKLIAAMNDEDAAIRYWGATGLGNIGKEASRAEGKMIVALQDTSVSVRVAAAKALCRIGRPDEALPVLVETLRGPYQWGRLQAAIVLDGIGPQARPAEAALKDALKDQPNKDCTPICK